jgi:hypothetical protein
MTATGKLNVAVVMEDKSNVLNVFDKIREIDDGDALDTSSKPLQLDTDHARYIWIDPLIDYDPIHIGFVDQVIYEDTRICVLIGSQILRHSCVPVEFQLIKVSNIMEG